MNRFLTLLAFPLLISCHGTGDEHAKTQESAAPAIKTDRQIYGIENELRLDTISPESLNSPAGLKIGEYYGSDNTEYSFCQNNELKITYTDRYFKTGKWLIKNDTIWMTLLKAYTKEGLGEPLPPPPAVPGNHQQRFSKYKEMVEVIHEKEWLDFSELLSRLQNDGEYPYKILERNIDCINEFE